MSFITLFHQPFSTFTFGALPTEGESSTGHLRWVQPFSTFYLLSSADQRRIFSWTPPSSATIFYLLPYELRWPKENLLLDTSVERYLCQIFAERSSPGHRSSSSEQPYPRHRSLPTQQSSPGHRSPLSEQPSDLRRRNNLLLDIDLYRANNLQIFADPTDLYLQVSAERRLIISLPSLLLIS